jgi:uncharacterized protein YjbK
MNIKDIFTSYGGIQTMNQEIEIEFKNLLSKEEFYSLLKEFSVSENQFILQQNHYFDTASFSLKEKGAALRIRYKKQSYTLTLKQPMVEGILETHQVLTDEEANCMLNGGPLVVGDVYSIIEALGVNPSNIQFLGTLETNRAQINYHGGLLVFDHSRYLNTEDFEIEFEAKEYTKGQQDFLTLLEQHKIPVRDTENKIRRFFNKRQC